MKQVVIDLPLLVSWFLPDQISSLSSKLLHAFDNGYILFHAPHSLPAFFSDYCVQHPSSHTCHEHFIEALSYFPIIYHNDMNLLPSSIYLTNIFNFSFNQALSLALAIDLGIPLCTADNSIVDLNLPNQLKAFIMPVKRYLTVSGFHS